MARRLKTIARSIEEEWPELEAKIVRGFCNTDRKIPGTRLRDPGKGRYGNRLIVTLRSTGQVLIDHSAAETYRHNSEVEYWIERWREHRVDRHNNKVP